MSPRAVKATAKAFPPNSLVIRQAKTSVPAQPGLEKYATRTRNHQKRAAERHQRWVGVAGHVTKSQVPAERAGIELIEEKPTPVHIQVQPKLNQSTQEHDR